MESKIQAAPRRSSTVILSVSDGPQQGSDILRSPDDFSDSEPIPPTRDLGRNLTAWLLGCAMVYLCLFGTGKLLLRQPGQGAVLLALSAASAYALYRIFVAGFNQEREYVRSANAEV